MMGRPKKEIDPAIVYELAQIQCTLEEIASVCDCDIKTITNRFSKEVDKGREDGKKSLRRAQWHKAVKDGNVVMQIWLGKQYLGQRDKADFDIQSGLTVIVGKDLEKL